MLEQVAGLRGLTAVVMCLPCAAATPAQMDAAAAQWVRQAPLAPPLLSHLPVLGIPGWWPENEDPAFYTDAAVFRERRGGAAARGRRKGGIDWRGRRRECR